MMLSRGMTSDPKLPPIPLLADYGITESRGFLPDVLPLTRLPDPYYNKWEDIVANLQALVLSGRLRAMVDRLPVLSTIGLLHDSEWRRAYTLLCFMAHAYIWGGDKPSDRLPKPIAAPLLEVAAHLEVPPVATYAAVCLWNFKPLFTKEDIDNLENLAMLNTFTGSLDESWFYMISVAIEARGAPIVPLMLEAIGAARLGDGATVTRCLQTFAECLTDLTAILQRMHENCDPTIFYNRIRPFLAGSKSMAGAGLPHGVLYEDGSGSEEYRQYSGGSNAQSSLIQFFDIILGIEHRPTGEKNTPGSESGGPSPTHNFISDMRRYMPGPHRRFLRDVTAVANIRQFVESNPGDKSLGLAYDACLAMLGAFRDKHIAIVTRYIVLPAREVRSRSRSQSPSVTRRRVNLATSTRREQEDLAPEQSSRKFKGTGGTALIPFLKQARDETGEPMINDWMRQLLSRQRKMETKAEPLGDKPVDTPQEEVKVNGLAGTWELDVDVGGLCHY